MFHLKRGEDIHDFDFEFRTHRALIPSSSGLYPTVSRVLAQHCSRCSSSKSGDDMWASWKVEVAQLCKSERGDKVGANLPGSLFQHVLE